MGHGHTTPGLAATQSLWFWSEESETQLWWAEETSPATPALCVPGRDRSQSHKVRWQGHILRPQELFTGSFGESLIKLIFMEELLHLPHVSVVVSIPLLVPAEQNSYSVPWYRAHLPEHLCIPRGCTLRIPSWWHLLLNVWSNSVFSVTKALATEFSCWWNMGTDESCHFINEGSSIKKKKSYFMAFHSNNIIFTC